MWRAYYPHWTERASVLNIDFLLLSKTFLPVGVAYKKTDNHGFSWYSAFSGQSFQLLLKHQARNDDGTIDLYRVFYMFPLLTMIPIKQIVARFGWHRIQTRKVAFIASFRRQQRNFNRFQCTTYTQRNEYIRIRNVIMYFLTVWCHKFNCDDVTWSL